MVLRGCLFFFFDPPTAPATHNIENPRILVKDTSVKTMDPCQKEGLACEKIVVMRR